jgi:phospholipid-binding lipoprotein MlaA
MRYLPAFILLLLLALGCPRPALADADAEAAAAVAAETGGDEEYFRDDWPGDDEYVVVPVADPLEPINRLFFNFNDKFYFWLLRPLARTYSHAVPKPARKCVGNFFYNLKMPIRFANNLLQGKFGRGATELTRFLVNTTVGVAGLWDPARHWLDLSSNEEDFGQTLGLYGIGEGFYICWPFFGPSNVRDTFGLAGDYLLDPISYLGFNGETEEGLAVKAGDTINRTSLSLGDYEDFKRATFDPYSALRDAYFQGRRAKIRDEVYK